MMFTILKSLNHSDTVGVDYFYLLPYLSYVVVLGMLFGWVENISQLRENGFFKMFTSLSGSKYHVIVVNYLVNLLLILCQSNILIALYFVICHQVSLDYIVMWNIFVIVTSAISFSELSILLLCRIKSETLQIMLTTYLIVGMYLLNVKVTDGIGHVLFSFINLAIDIGRSLYDTSSYKVFMDLVIAGMIGGFSIPRISVFPQKNRG